MRAAALGRGKRKVFYRFGFCSAPPGPDGADDTYRTGEWRPGWVHARWEGVKKHAGMSAARRSRRSVRLHCLE